MIYPLQSYINLVSKSSFTTVFSQLDHDIVYTKDTGLIISCLSNKPDVSSLSLDEKLALVTTIEEFFIRVNEIPPSWIFEDEFYAKPPIYPECVLKLADIMKNNSDKFLETVKENAYPLCKKRGYYASRPLDVY